MSIRYDRIDNLWFVLRHEIEHVLRGDGRVDGMLDVDLMDDDFADRPEEIAANDAAQEFVVPEAEITNFIARVRPLYRKSELCSSLNGSAFTQASSLGELQRRREIPFTHFKKHQVKIRHIITETALVDGWGDAPDLKD